MRHQQIEKRQEGLYGVIGTLGFDCVVLVEKEGFLAIDESPDGITFDLSQVQCSSSASMALLLSWQRYCKKANKSMVIKGLPERLRAMLSRVGLLQVFQIA